MAPTRAKRLAIRECVAGSVVMLSASDEVSWVIAIDSDVEGGSHKTVMDCLTRAAMFRIAQMISQGSSSYSSGTDGFVASSLEPSSECRSCATVTPTKRLTRTSFFPHPRSRKAARTSGSPSTFRKALELHPSCTTLDSRTTRAFSP